MNEMLQLLIGIGVLIGGIGYGFGKLREGTIKSKLDTTNLLKEQIAALDSKVTGQETEIARLTKEVHDLQALIELKDSKLSEVLGILQGRDPQTKEVMELLKRYVEEAKPFLERVSLEVLPVVTKLDKFLNTQTF